MQATQENGARANDQSERGDGADAEDDRRDLARSSVDRGGQGKPSQEECATEQADAGKAVGHVEGQRAPIHVATLVPESGRDYHQIGPCLG